MEPNKEINKRLLNAGHKAQIARGEWVLAKGRVRLLVYKLERR